MGLRIKLNLSLAIGWLLLVAATALLAVQRGPQFDTSILTLLPDSESRVLLREADRRAADTYANRLLLLVTGAERTATREAVGGIAAELSELGVVASVRWRLDAAELSAQRSALYPYRFGLLDEQSRKLLQQKEFELLGQGALLRLFSPLGSGGGDIVSDPFGFFSAWWLQVGGEFRLDQDDGLLQLPGAVSPAYLMIVELDGDPFSAGVQQSVLSAIESQRQRWRDRIESIRISGMLVHAAAAARQVKAEISTIGLGSMIGITLLVVFVFGRTRPLLLLLFPIAVGCIFAAAVTLLAFSRIHLVTLAFGAGLVGLAVDYSLHFLCQQRYLPAAKALERIFTGLWLGLVSSAMAYAVMLLTPFPGLRQMATFSIAGLAGAWLTVVLWLPLLTAADRQQPIRMAASLAGFRDHFPRAGRFRWLRWALGLAALIAAALLWQAPGRDDLRLLQTSPQALLAEEQAMLRALDVADASRYLLVSGENIEQCLQREEALRPQLDALVGDGLMAGYQAISKQLPSMRRQEENRALVGALYATELPRLYGRLNLPAADLAEARASLEKSAQEMLTPRRWSELLADDSLSAMLVATEGSSATLIRLRGVDTDSAAPVLQRIADRSPGVFYVDRVQRITQLMRDFRLQVGQWVVTAFLLVSLLLTLRYRADSWRILLPPLLASLAALAIQAQVAGGLNLFNVLAVILVIGIGLDMGIFLAETDEAAHTWLAVSLSAWTSLLAFGLLSLSATPVLYHFGSVVAIGLCLVWLITPLLRRHEASV